MSGRIDAAVVRGGDQDDIAFAGLRLHSLLAFTADVATLVETRGTGATGADGAS